MSMILSHSQSDRFIYGKIDIFILYTEIVFEMVPVCVFQPTP
jgi:hypothetical protein